MSAIISGEECCLYPVGKSTTKCLYELRQLDDDNEIDLEQRFLGAHSLTGGGENFSNTEPRYAAAQFALEQINEAVEKGMLDEMGNFLLLKEAILAIATKYNAELGLKFPNIKRYNPVKTPLDLQVLMKRLQTYFGENYYLDQWTIEQIKKDKYVKMEFIGKINAYAISSDYHAVPKIKVRAKTEAMAGKRFPPHGEKDLKILPELLDTLIVKQEQIENSVLPRADVPPPYPDSNCPDWAFSDSQIEKVLECLFREGLIAYKKLLERNFSGILMNFPFYQSFPITAVIAYDRSSIRNRRGGTVSYCFVPAHDSVTGAKVYLAPPESIFRSKDTTVLIDGKYVKTKSMHYTSFGHLFKAYEAPILEATILAPIRAFAYKLIINKKNKSARFTYLIIKWEN